LTWDPADPELGRVEEKTGKEKARRDLITRLKTQLQPIDFYFILLKLHHFNFKNIIQITRLSKSMTWTGLE
jgi:hypothetical protein